MKRSLVPWLPLSIALHSAALAWAVHVPRLKIADPLPPAPSMSGETFDVDPPNDEPEERPTSASERQNPSEMAATSGDGPASPTHRRGSSSSRLGETSTSTGELGAIFGASGDRTAVDLPTAFTRTFPQVASADSAWSRASIGSAGSVDVALQIDDAGDLVSATVRGDAEPLHANAERVLSLLRHRLFTSVGGYATTLHVSASISRDAVHDGLHGDVFAVGGSFISGEGDAFFALSIGRRIDVHVVTRR